MGAALALHGLAACNLLAGLGQFDGATAADAANGEAEAGSPAPGPPDASTDESNAPDVRDAFAADGPDDIGAGYGSAVRYDFESGQQGWMRNQYNSAQNWGVVSVLQVVDPAQESDTVEDAGAVVADAPSGDAAEAGPDASADAGQMRPTGDAGAPEAGSLAARYSDGGINHVLQISYDYSLKPEGSSVGSYLEVVNSGFEPPTLGTVHGLTLSLDIYVEHVSDLDPTVQVLVQDSSYANCFFAYFSLLGVSDRTWVTLSSSNVGVCAPGGAPTTPQQMCFQFDPQAGAGSVYIDNISW